MYQKRLSFNDERRREKIVQKKNIIVKINYMKRILSHCTMRGAKEA